jgi:hypothetical protein
VKRPAGVTIIAVLKFFGAALLALGSIAFFFVAVMVMTGGDAGDPISVAIAGMGVAGGFSMLVLAGGAACLTIGVAQLSEWARIASIASIAVGIGCTIFSLFALKGYLVIPVLLSILCHLLVMATAVWMLAYLLLPRVRQVFGALTAEPAQ